MLVMLASWKNTSKPNGRELARRRQKILGRRRIVKEKWK
jgi:hypothetical protein